MPIRNVFDQTLKIMARNYTHVFLHLAFPNQPICLLGTVENVELALPVHPVDFVHRVEYEGQEYLLHIEFQLVHEKEFPKRLCYYNGALGEQFDLPVLTLALYVRPGQAALPQAYEVALGDKVVNRFSYPVLRLWDYVDEIRSGKYRELAPLLLVLLPDEKTQVLEEERALIMAEPDAQKRRDLLALAITIATQHFDSRYLWQFFTEQEVRQMQDSTFIEELLADKISDAHLQGHQEGWQEGLEKGAKQTIYESILDVLVTRFNPPASQYRQIERQLGTIQDLGTFRTLLLALVQAEDVGEFEQALAQAAEDGQDV